MSMRLSRTLLILIPLIFFLILSFYIIVPWEKFYYRQVVYKSVDYDDLSLLIYPSRLKKTKKTILLFYHGGAWENGSPLEFHEYGKYFSNKGYVCISIEYRLANKRAVTPLVSLEDCVDAGNWVHNNRAIFGGDEREIVLIGGSAGAHLAFWVANAMIEEGHNVIGLGLLNPVINTTRTGFGSHLFGENAETYSPIHNMPLSLPPTLLVHSENDSIISRSDIIFFLDYMKEKGNRVTFKIIQNGRHGEYYWHKKSQKPHSLEFLEDWLLIIES